MGCYGIGVSRIVAAAIEQNYDERGITVPVSMAPFHIAIAPIGMKKSIAVAQAVEQLYAELSALPGVDVLLDDRDERPGVMFADLELMGIPYRIVIGDRGLGQERPVVEFQGRHDDKAQQVPLQEIVDLVKLKLCV